MNHTDDRLAVLERRTLELTRRLGEVEDRLAATAPRSAPAPGGGWAAPERPDANAPAPAAPPPPSVAAAAARTAAQAPGRVRPALPQRSALEDLVGGRVLAWAGGVTVLVGIVLLVAVAVSRGWIGEAQR